MKKQHTHECTHGHRHTHTGRLTLAGRDSHSWTQTLTHGHRHTHTGRNSHSQAQTHTHRHRLTLTDTDTLTWAETLTHRHRLTLAGTHTGVRTHTGTHWQMHMLRHQADLRPAQLLLAGGSWLGLGLWGEDPEPGSRRRSGPHPPPEPQACRWLQALPLAGKAPTPIGLRGGRFPQGRPGPPGGQRLPDLSFRPGNQGEPGQGQRQAAQPRGTQPGRPEQPRPELVDGGPGGPLLGAEPFTTGWVSWRWHFPHESPVVPRSQDARCSDPRYRRAGADGRDGV